MSVLATPYIQPLQPPTPRFIVALTTLNGRLVRTRNFKTPIYVGDPINAVKIFSDKSADELVLLEIGQDPFDTRRESIIRDIATEAFMPISYGGGIKTIEHVRIVIRSGFEKVVLNTVIHESPNLVKDAANEFGAQAVVGSIDVARNWLRGEHVRSHSGRYATKRKPEDWAKYCEDLGCGELLLTSIDRDGTMSGYDTDLIARVSAVVSIPVISLGGAGAIEHLRSALSAGASAVAAGSMFVFHGPRRAVLINYPNSEIVLR